MIQGRGYNKCNVTTLFSFSDLDVRLRLELLDTLLQVNHWILQMAGRGLVLGGLASFEVHHGNLMCYRTQWSSLATSILTFKEISLGTTMFRPSFKRDWN